MMPIIYLHLPIMFRSISFGNSLLSYSTLGTEIYTPSLLIGRNLQGPTFKRKITVSDSISLDDLAVSFTDVH